jgi:Ni,Fe-hydrogenase III small subunit
MLKLLFQILRVGVKTDKLKQDNSLERVGLACQKIIDRRFARSLAIRMVDAGSCNGCELEMHSLNNVFYNVERFGIHFVASPRHADILLVTGVVSRHMEEALKRTYAAMAEPKWVIAMGDCATKGGVFGVSYASLGSVSNVIPVDVSIPGCPPAPLDVLHAILNCLKKK